MPQIKGKQIYNDTIASVNIKDGTILDVDISSAADIAHSKLDISWQESVSTYSNLPATGNSDGDIRMIVDTARIYQWDESGSEWALASVSGFEILGIGTDTVPHGGVGSAKFAIDGTDSSADGPHVQFTTASDDYPIFSIVPWSHDNTTLYFDSYFDGTVNRSSDAGTNFILHKNADVLKFRVNSGTAVGNTIGSFTDALAIDSTGRVGIGTTDPSEKLEVNGNIAISGGYELQTDKINITSVNPSDNATIFGDDATGASTLHIRIGNDADDKIQIESWNGTSSTSLMEIGLDTVTITGNLIVSGTTTTVNTETIQLADNTILLNSNATGAASEDAGIEIERGDDANVSLFWDESEDAWSLTDTTGTFFIPLAAASTGLTMDETYNGGSAVTVDTTDVDWLLSAAHDFRIYDGTDGDKFVVTEGAGIKMDTAAGVDIDSGTNSFFSVTTGDLTLETITSGTLNLKTTTAGDIVINSAGAITIDAVTGFTVDENSGAHFALTTAGQVDMDSASGQIVDITSDTEVQINGGALVDIDGTNVTIDGILAITGDTSITGNLGIGDTPSYKLHVKDTSSTTIMTEITNANSSAWNILKNDTTEYLKIGLLGSSAAPSSYPDMSSSDAVIHASGGKLHFSADNAGNATSHMIIDTTGQVGLGSTLVFNYTEVGTGTVDANIKVERGASPDVAIRWNETYEIWQFTNDGSTYYSVGTNGVDIEPDRIIFNADNISASESTNSYIINKRVTPAGATGDIQSMDKDTGLTTAGYQECGLTGKIGSDETGLTGPPGYKRTCELIIQASEVSATLTNFPVLITKDNLPSEIFDADGDNFALNGGGDILFSSDSLGTNRLACEIVEFVTDNDPANGIAEIWVNVPSISSSVDTSIWIWYHKAGESQPARGAAYGMEATWNSNFVGVWHLNEASGDAIDSTSHTTNGTVSAGAIQEATGQIGKAYDFPEQEYVEITDPVDGHLDFGTGSFSISLWLNVDVDTAGFEIMLYKGGEQDSSPGYDFEWSSGSLISGIADGTNYASSNSIFVSLDTWYHISTVVDKSSDEFRIYQDGAEQGSPVDISSIGNVDSGSSLVFGHWDAAWAIDGLLDEIRISDIDRSAGWIAAEYSNQDDPATFIIEQTPTNVGYIVGYKRKCELIIQASKVSATLTDFPVLLIVDNLPSEIFDADGLYPAANGGGDICFSSDSLGTLRLACEIVSFVTDNDPANGIAEIWVNVPLISSSVDTSIWIWYHKPGESQPAEDAAYGMEATWNNGFALIAHMSDITTSTIKDSTSNDNDGAKKAANQPVEIDGPWGGGKGQDFDYTNEHSIDLGDNASLDIDTIVTVECWIKWAGPTADYNTIFSSGSNSGNYFQFAVDDDDYKLRFRNDGRTYALASTTLTAGVWYHAVMVKDGDSGSNLQFYLDSVGDGLSGVGASGSSGNKYIGSRGESFPSHLFDGIIDELRVSNVARDSDWIGASFNNQDDPTTFVIEQTPTSSGTNYYFKVNEDGDGLDEYNISVSPGGNTFTATITLLNVETTGLATWSLTGGDLRCTSDTSGDSSSIALAAGDTGTDLFATLTGFTSFDDAVAGTSNTLHEIVLDTGQGASWTADDYIEVYDATDPDNNSIYRVESVATDAIVLDYIFHELTSSQAGVGGNVRQIDHVAIRWDETTNKWQIDNGTGTFGDILYSSQSTITADTDILDVANVNSVMCDTSSNSITIGGLINGVAGQTVRIVKEHINNNLIIEHQEGVTGSQNINTNDAADITLANYGGVTLTYNGTDWYVVSE